MRFGKVLPNPDFSFGWRLGFAQDYSDSFSATFRNIRFCTKVLQINAHSVRDLDTLEKYRLALQKQL
jgi:hypothetical protein